MKTINTGRLITAFILIGLGVVFLVFNLVPGLKPLFAWPVVFFLLAVGFYLPPFLFPASRQELSSLFIPGTIMLGLGILFYYNVVTGDWGAWAYAWTLIPASVGLGMALAAWYGGWRDETAWVGLWIMAGAITFFTIFSSIFGEKLIQVLGPGLLILAGLLILFRSIFRSKGKPQKRQDGSL